MLKQNDIILAFGRKGQGKSSLANSIIACYERVIILDKLCEYDYAGVVSYDLPSAGQFLLRLSAGKNRVAPFRLVCQFHSDHDIDFLFDIVWSVGNCCFLIEELDYYADAKSIHPKIYDLINYGRHRAISIIGCARRPHSVSRDITAQADAVATFNQSEPRDVEYLHEIFGEGALQCTTLENFHYIVFGESHNPNVNKILQAGITIPIEG